MLRLVVTAVLAMAATAVAVAPSLGLASERVGTGVLSRGSTSVSLQNTPSPVPTPSDDPEEEDEAAATPAATPTAEPTPAATPARTPEPTPTATPKRTPEPTRKPEHPATAKPAAAPENAALWDALLRTCLSSSAGEECFRLLAQNGISLSEFKSRVMSRLEALAKRRAALAEEFELYLKKCIASGSAESDACHRAWILSGMPLPDFRAKIAAKMATPKPTVKPTPRPTAKPASELELALRSCIDSHELYGIECYHAWELSGLTSEEFDRKIQKEWERH